MKMKTNPFTKPGAVVLFCFMALSSCTNSKLPTALTALKEQCPIEADNSVLDDIYIEGDTVVFKATYKLEIAEIRGDSVSFVPTSKIDMLRFDWRNYLIPLLTDSHSENLKNRFLSNYDQETANGLCKSKLLSLRQSAADVFREMIGAGVSVKGLITLKVVITKGVEGTKELVGICSSADLADMFSSSEKMQEAYLQTGVAISKLGNGIMWNSFDLDDKSLNYHTELQMIGFKKAVVDKWMRKEIMYNLNNNAFAYGGQELVQRAAETGRDFCVIFEGIIKKDTVEVRIENKELKNIYNLK